MPLPHSRAHDGAAASRSEQFQFVQVSGKHAITYVCMRAWLQVRGGGEARPCRTTNQPCSSATDRLKPDSRRGSTGIRRGRIGIATVMVQYESAINLRRYKTGAPCVVCSRSAEWRRSTARHRPSSRLHGDVPCCRRKTTATRQPGDGVRKCFLLSHLDRTKFCTCK